MYRLVCGTFDPCCYSFMYVKPDIFPRLPNAKQHHFVLEFLRSVSRCYVSDKRGEHFITHLLRQDIKLFASKGDTADPDIQREFTEFLCDYINRNSLKEATLRNMPIILVR